MHVDFHKVLEVFRKVRQLKEHKELYCLDPKRIPVSVSDLTRVIADMYDLKIEVFEVVFTGDRLRSLVERYKDNHAIIYVKHDLTPEVQRFSVTKELMHLAIDEPEDWSPAGVATLQSFFTEMSIANGDHLAEARAQSEALAEIAAIEILYPYEFRADDAAAIASRKTTWAKLSLHYELPRYIVTRAHADWYKKVADAAWDAIGQ
jgi:Zn-dependent peptidase ImmA (M78 family)